MYLYKQLILVHHPANSPLKVLEQNLKINQFSQLSNAKYENGTSRLVQLGAPGASTKSILRHERGSHKEIIIDGSTYELHLLKMPEMKNTQHDMRHVAFAMLHLQHKQIC